MMRKPRNDNGQARAAAHAAALRPASQQHVFGRSTWALAVLVVFIGLSTRSLAQSTVVGTVIDSANAEPVVGAAANLLGTSFSSSSDLDGRLTFHAIPNGHYTMRVAAIGYRPTTIALDVNSAEVAITIKLASESEQLEEVIVSATRTNSRIEDAPQKIEVLGEEELVEESSLKPGNIASLIGDVSSVQIQQTSASSGASVVRMQGLDGRYTLLLRDGMPAYGGLSGGFDLLRIPPLDLQRVEMLKGPSSTFNGGGAIAGAINFVSKSPTDSLSGMALVNASSLHERNANLFLSGPLGKAGFTLFAGSTFQEAIDVDGNGYSDVPYVRSHVVHPQVFAKPWKNGQLRVGGLWQQDDRTGGDMSGINDLSDTSYFASNILGRRLAGDLSLEQTISTSAKLTVKGSVNTYDQHERDPFGSTTRDQQNQYAEAFWSHRTDRRTWVLGANMVSSQMRGDGLTPQDLSTVGAFAQLALHRKRWPEIDLGLRTDKANSYDPIVLPSVAALYQVSKTITVRANAGAGYQLPDRSRNYALVTEGTIAQRLADGTRPERSFGGTAEWTWKKPLTEHTLLFVDQTFFATNIDPSLGVKQGGDGFTSLYNTGGTALTRGVDTYVRLTHKPLEVYLGYTYTLPQAQVNGTTVIVPYTPQHRAAATVSREFGEHWRAGLEASWSGQQTRTDGSHTRDQLFMAAMVGYASGRWNLVLNGENITDTRQTRWEQVVSGPRSRPVFAPLWAPIDGRVINLSVLYRFGWVKV